MAKHWFYCYDHYISLSYYLSAKKEWTIWKNCNKFFGKEWATHFKLFYSLVSAENHIKIHLVNLTHGGLCSDYVDGYAKGIFFFSFLIWYNMLRHYFAVATGTTIYCSLDRQYGGSVQSIFLRWLWIGPIFVEELFSEAAPLR